MTPRQYLSEKYNTNSISAVTNGEAIAFGIPIPLRSKWQVRIPDTQISLEAAAKIVRYLSVKSKNATMPAKKAFLDRGVAILLREFPDLATGKELAIMPIPVLTKKQKKAAVKLEKRKKYLAFIKEGGGSKPKVFHKPEWKPAYHVDVNSDSFLESYEWRRVRMVALKKYGPRCQCCGATPADGVKMHVDHIKPRRIFPDLALDVANLQILCEVCNHGKGNWDMTDWRETELDPEAKAHMKSI